MQTIERTETEVLINPATGEVVGRHKTISRGEAEEALAEMQQAFFSWRKTSMAERSKVLNRMAELLEKNRDSLARRMTEEMGKTLAEACEEVALVAEICRYTAECGPTQLQDEERKLDGGRAIITYQPTGIIFGIQPWNFPLYQAVRYTAPNLMAGNVVALKHAANVWGTADVVEELLLEAGLPENVFRHLKVSHEVAEAMIGHSLVRGVTFTGSSRTGARLASLAGKAMKKTVLEMGSNDAYLVLGDADLEIAVRTSVEGRLNNCGQTCVAAKRFVVVEKLYNEFQDAFLKALKKVKMGDPTDSATDIGPLARRDLRETLHRQVTESVMRGAKLLLGGEMPEGPGYFYPPTLLGEVKPGMPAYDDELFGPVAALIRADDDEHALQIANDSRYGLGGGIFSRNESAAIEIARNRFDTGMVNINGYNVAKPHLPFGGVKNSGYGREHGGFGVREFVNIKTLMIAGS